MELRLNWRSLLFISLYSPSLWPLLRAMFFITLVEHFSTVQGSWKSSWTVYLLPFCSEQICMYCRNSYKCCLRQSLILDIAKHLSVPIASFILNAPRYSSNVLKWVFKIQVNTHKSTWGNQLWMCSYAYLCHSFLLQLLCSVHSSVNHRVLLLGCKTTSAKGPEAAAFQSNHTPHLLTALVSSGSLIDGVLNI